MKNPWNELLTRLLELARHALILGLLLGTTILLHQGLESLISKDTKFFDVFPVRNIFYIVDGFVIVTFIINIIKSFFYREAERDIKANEAAQEKQADTSPNLNTKRSQLAVVELLAEYKSKRNTIASFLLLISVSVYVILSSKLGYEINIGIISIVWFLLLALYVNQKALTYRIRKGFYGTNEYEAREIIQYILRNSDEEDYFDSNGLRQTFLQPQQDSSNEPLTDPGLGEVKA